MLELTAGLRARFAAPTDDDAVTQMCVALYREDPGTRPVHAEDVGRTLAHFRAHPERGGVLVLLRDAPARDAPGTREIPVGYAVLCAYWSNELGGLIAIVDELYVRPEARSQGIAKALFDALAAGRVAGFASLVAIDLEVTPDNARARALYARLGFAPLKNAHMRRRLPG